MVKAKGGKVVYVKVIKTPVGEAPELVRRQWVGVVLETTGPVQPLWEMELLTGADRLERRFGYEVKYDKAINALKTHSPAAADWFKENVRFKSANLTFGADEVVEIQNEGYR